MLFQRINRSDPEKCFIVVKNGWSTASLTSGQAVCWDLGDSDGVTVSQSGGANRAHAFAGIASETIAAGAYGLIQVYGYHSSVIVDSNTAVDIWAGAPLFANVTAFNLEGPWIASAATAGVGNDTIGAPCAVALTAYGSVGTTGGIKAMIFAL